MDDENLSSDDADPELSSIDLGDFADPPFTEPTHSVGGSDSAVEAIAGAPRRHVRSVTRRRRRIVIRSLLLVFLVLLASAAVVVQRIASEVSGSSGGRKVSLDVKAGWSYGIFASQLQADSVIRSASIFDLYLKVKSPPVLQPGFYSFSTHEGFASILATLGRGPKLFKVTIPDGFSLGAIASVIGALPGHSSASFLALAKNTPPVRAGFAIAGVKSAEGFLYPDTYLFDPTESNAMIIDNLMSQFAVVAKQIGLRADGNYNGLSGFQVVVAASIIEREAKALSDYPKVARVILNRLSVGKPLQMDSTVRYATNNFSGPITVSQLASTSPYNTYTHTGLPPGPISAPGKAALEAVLHPANGSWLYFVTLKGRTLSSFFDTYQQQQSAIVASGGL